MTASTLVSSIIVIKIVNWKRKYKLANHICPSDNISDIMLTRTQEVDSTYWNTSKICKTICSVITVITFIFQVIKAVQCDLFHNGLFCSLEPISNIFDLNNKMECQKQCEFNIDCNQFLYATFASNRSSECFLLTECNTNTTSCGDKTSPLSHRTKDSWDQFQGVTCETKSEIGHFCDFCELSECIRNVGT